MLMVSRWDHQRAHTCHPTHHAAEDALTRVLEEPVDLGEVGGRGAGRIVPGHRTRGAVITQQRIDVCDEGETADDERAEPEREGAAADREQGLEPAVEEGAQRRRPVDVGPELGLDEG